MGDVQTNNETDHVLPFQFYQTHCIFLKYMHHVVIKLGLFQPVTNEILIFQKFYAM